MNWFAPHLRVTLCETAGRHFPSSHRSSAAWLAHLLANSPWSTFAAHLWVVLGAGCGRHANDILPAALEQIQRRLVGVVEHRFLARVVAEHREGRLEQQARDVRDFWFPLYDWPADAVL